MTLGSHQITIGKSQVHLTPRWLLNALGPFELDPAAANPRPWDCARRNFTEADDGLKHKWVGRVFLNPPFDRREVGRWTQKMAEHGHGILLTHARTEADWFLPIWERASGILFLADRIKFCKPDGSTEPFNSGAPALLASFGAKDLAVLRSCGLTGVLVTSWEPTLQSNRQRATPAQKKFAHKQETDQCAPTLLHAATPPMATPSSDRTMTLTKRKSPRPSVRVAAKTGGR